MYPVAWVPTNTRLQGNLGECIAFCCAQFAWTPLPHCIAANAFRTLADTSRTGIDLLWVGFGQQAEEDFVIHQEVKTTTLMDLSYASALIDDYQKSFGANPNLTLNTHLHEIKSKLQYEWGRPEFVGRINALQAASPRQADRLTVVPTLVHDLNAEDPVPKLAGIEAELMAQGWKKVEAWAIGFDAISNHLKKMAEDTA